MGKLYLAGKLNEGEGSIDAVATELEERGHEITFKWWDSNEPKLPTPYLDHMETSQPAADAMEAAVRAATTAVILFPQPNILGAMGEFCIAVGDRFRVPDREIIVVDPFETRQSVFYALSAVIALRGLAELRERPWY